MKENPGWRLSACIIPVAGNGAKFALVCIYGNRAYEDTLVEMENAAKECGFRVVAAIAAVAEHSILPQYASNRPDASDEKQFLNGGEDETC